MLSSPAFWPTVAVLAAIAVLLLWPNRFENEYYRLYQNCRARVVEVDDRGIKTVGVVAYGEQVCQVEILEGDQRGRVIWAVNALTGSLETDKLFAPGDTALVMIGVDEMAGIFKATMIDHYRLHYEAILALAFVGLLIAVAGWIGVRAVLSFVFTVLCIFKVLIPGFLSGYNPIVFGGLITVVLTCVIIALVYGFDRRFMAALAGTILGLGLTTALAVIFVSLFKFHGTVMSYSESLLYSGYSSLNLTKIFIASVFLASSGALTDVAVDITSAVHEVVKNNPGLSRLAAVAAGMNVGRAALGTMTTTLLLAYSGSCIGLLMVFVAQGTPLINVLNLNFVSAEILNTIIGSLGLVTVAPFTALAAGMVLGGGKGD